ncbi:hypothetical protein P9D28_09080 [Bacillus haynesii]|uniref:hypothetical protein n=1 Tax=Bacillus haynesii TaxID=1925021 RepID=UPI002DB75D53|nr:hypothetical protein [Bacillus haynesii]MEC1552579.1 hypothetical protein [Bacillus haynesii]
MRRRGMRRRLNINYRYWDDKEAGEGRLIASLTNWRRMSPSLIRSMEKEIEKTNGFEKVIITNYQYF